MVLAHPHNAVILYFAAGAVVLFVIAFVHQQTEQNEELKSFIKGATNKIWPSKSSAEPSFFEIATAQGTDKVGPHHYEDMYEVYFPPLRHKKLKMLEIGLGCDMVSRKIPIVSAGHFLSPSEKPSCFRIQVTNSFVASRMGREHPTTPGWSISPTSSSTSWNTTPIVRTSGLRRPKTQRLSQETRLIREC